MAALANDPPPLRVTRDKQLAVVDVSVALFKWNHGIACNLKEVAVVTGYYYAHVRRWGLPLFDGKITRSEFITWKRKKMEETKPNEANGQFVPPADRPQGPATAARQRRLDATKFDGSLRRGGSAASSQSRPELAETAGNTK
jgi:hypothetical protein